MINNYVFIHVPKTGGNYLRIALHSAVTGQLTNDDNHYVSVDVKHDVLVDYPPIGSYIDPWFNFAIRDISELVYKICFAIVRNPYDWLVSYYHVVPFGVGATSFTDFVTTIANRTKEWPCRKLIFFPFFSYNGDFLIDYLFHQDTLDAELQEFADATDGFYYDKHDRVKVSAQRTNPDYKVYYTDELIDVVAKTWNRELRLYGYNFDGRTKGLLANTVTPEVKTNLRYFWDKDLLLSYGEEIP